MADERAIRNWLAKDLSIIEDGLRVVSVEYHLQNQFGSRGFIDILARDRFGLLVIVEVKRSDQVARQAIHELCKYAALVKAQYGLGAQGIRSILLSTEWSELRMPFSEYARSADHPVSGFLLKVGPCGEVEEVIPVQPIPASEERELCPSHMIYLFASAEARDRAARQAARAISGVGVANFCILELNRQAKGIPYPYANYAAMDVITLCDRSRLGEHLPMIVEAEELELNRWFLEECAWAAINAKITCDSMEIGYPEKLLTLLQTWSVQRINRSGRFSAAEVIPDEALLEQLAGLTGTHSAAFHAVMSPKFRQAWADTLSRAQMCMAFNKTLGSIFDWYTQEGLSPESTVAIAIFNPANIMASLYVSVTRMNPKFLQFPYFELVVSEGKSARILDGFLLWDGATFPDDPAKIAGLIERTPWDFFLLWANNGLAEYDSVLMQAHGLSFAFVETTLGTGEEPVCRWVHKTNGSWTVTSELRSDEVLTVGDFVAQNPVYLVRLIEFVHSNIIEIP